MNLLVEFYWKDKWTSSESQSLVTILHTRGQSVVTFTQAGQCIVTFTQTGDQSVVTFTQTGGQSVVTFSWPTGGATN